MPHVKASKVQQSQRVKEVYDYLVGCHSKRECIDFMLSKRWFTTERQAHNIYLKAVDLLHTDNDIDIAHDRAFLRAAMKKMIQEVDEAPGKKLTKIKAKLQVVKQYAELLGIDAPKRLDIKGLGGVDLNSNNKSIDYSKLSDAALNELYEQGIKP